ncbi:MAG: nuclear transport factor 2 family protein [candidate division Zixibacteria bacterium]|nr:nuclear transport factor 2 family protein [candidate division Zixibacteria bacterium]
MKKLILVLIGLLITLQFWGCSKKTDPKQIVANARELDERYVAMVNQEDLTGVMECHWNSPELVFYSPISMQETGYETVRASYENLFAQNEIKNVAFTDKNYMAMGEYGLSWGTAEGSLGTPDGKVVNLKIRYMNLSGMKDGKWVYLLRHGSAPLPPPPTVEQLEVMLKDMKKRL